MIQDVKGTHRAIENLDQGYAEGSRGCYKDGKEGYVAKHGQASPVVQTSILSKPVLLTQLRQARKGKDETCRKERRALSVASVVVRYRGASRSTRA